MHMILTGFTGMNGVFALKEDMSVLHSLVQSEPNLADSTHDGPLPPTPLSPTARSNNPVPPGDGGPNISEGEECGLSFGRPSSAVQALASISINRPAGAKDNQRTATTDSKTPV